MLDRVPELKGNKHDFFADDIICNFVSPSLCKAIYCMEFFPLIHSFNISFIKVEILFYLTEGHFPKPVIAVHPKTQVILLKGENVTLNCSAASTETQGSTASFQWKKDNVVRFWSQYLICQNNRISLKKN